jgi:CubicO group peptidase (beta-lactamase class C family)
LELLDSSFHAACAEAAARWDVPALAVGVLADGRTAVACVDTGPDTVFRIASITKPFTATLAASTLDLDAEVGVWPDVTVRHLLSHTSGYDCECGDLRRFGDGDDALERCVRELPSVHRWLPAGEAWSYCNAGYWLAGWLAAGAVGSTYEEALRARVLEPAGLEATSFGEPDLVGYDIDPSGARVASTEGVYPRARRPSGGLVSTVPDLLRFAAWQLREPSTEVLRRPVAPAPDGEYGLGFLRERVGGVDVWGHQGSYGGFRSSLLLVPERGLAFASLSSSGGGEQALRALEDELFARFLGARREQPATHDVPADELELLSGRYAQPQLEATLGREDGGLLVELVEVHPTSGERTEWPGFRARPLGARVFELVDGPAAGARFDFLPASGGRPRFARLFSRLAERVE